MTRTTVPNLIELSDNDVAIIGGGLSGLLTAWRIADVTSNTTVHVFEAKAEPKWVHHWSFNLSDVPRSLRSALEPAIRTKWPEYEVRFPKRERVLDIAYASTDDLAIESLLEPYRDSGRIVLHRGRKVEPEEVTAGAVLDARGYQDRDDTLIGYQKFVGRRVRLKKPHGLKRPVIMDATVEQIDGYRFMYLLPFDEREVLVEDTYFSDTPALSENLIVSRIEAYCADKGWEIESILHSERGVLPMTTATCRDDKTAEIGLRGGFAISATGFTFPVALQLAEHVAQTIRHKGVSAAEDAVADYRQRHIRRERYARLLNRMFFGAADPSKRYVILQRFYGLRRGLIERFYRNDLTLIDKLRILVGKPPVPVTRALYNFSEKRFMRRARARTDS